MVAMPGLRGLIAIQSQEMLRLQDILRPKVHGLIHPMVTCAPSPSPSAAWLDGNNT